MPARDALAAWLDWAAGAPRVGFHTDFDRVGARARAGGAGPARRPAHLARSRSAGRRAGARGAYRYGGRSLDDWLAAFGIECSIRHNAAADALATAELLLRLRALAAKQGTRGFAALVKAAKQQKWLGASD